jgi:exosome complex component RRP43
MGNTTIVCGVKAEISEPELDHDEDGFLGNSIFFATLPSICYKSFIDWV